MSVKQQNIPTSYVAHVKKKINSEEWDKVHKLSEHLLETSKFAQKFAEDFTDVKDSDEWASLIGLWHDLGKYRLKFQDYIRINSGYEKENAHIENGKRRSHSMAGAIYAIKKINPFYGHIIAYLIAGHHAGLPDWEGGRSSLRYRLDDGQAEFNEAMSEDIPEAILAGGCPDLPKIAQSPESIALWMRMLFSCLVDADFLDTEAYMSPDKAIKRDIPISLDYLQNQFNDQMKKLQKNSKPSSLNTIRDLVLNECLDAAELKPGLFSLTVPTGGGKTLSSLGFALKHAQLHKKKRIIYAIPFTSIIEQNADVFRKFLGDESVLEHHSSLDVSPEKENSRARLAIENWNAPLIVTTNVQLFESLFASRTSRCRKLHNIANSVIILDEAQQIPRDFHAPITQVMQQLSDYFGVTWVLCTATQPVLKESQNPFGQILLKGLNNVREIISKPSELSKKLNRVNVTLPKKDDPKVSWQELASIISSEDCILIIVNSRRQARTLFELLPDDGNKLHLSANMCAQHRTEVIDEIKTRLKGRRKGDMRHLRVVSTQLIEAGVDVDFPVVYRSIAGIDSIAQSAGRCNREGLLNKQGELGKVVVFQPEQASPAGFLRQGEDITQEMITSGTLSDPLAPKVFEQYFTLMNNKGDRDKHKICDDLKASCTNDAPLAIQFRTAAEKFRLIDNVGTSIIVPFRPTGKDKSPIDVWITILVNDPSKKWVYKKLQRYTVTIPEQLLKEFINIGCLDTRAGLYVLLDPYYHKLWGVDLADTLISAKDSVY
ncbi:MAG: CRISPR-associated helicase Cas3' [Pseudomonadota bacterium]